MGKVHNTRKQRAAQILERVTKGPSLHMLRFSLDLMTPKDIAEEFEMQYRNWARSWVLDDLQDLVPELRKKPNGR